jgi:hypothetical protein
MDLQNRVMTGCGQYIKRGGDRDLRDDADEADKQKAMDELEVCLEWSNINDSHSNGDQSSLRGLQAQVPRRGISSVETLSRC